MKLIISFNVNKFVECYNSYAFVDGGGKITIDETYRLLSGSMEFPLVISKNPDIVWLNTEEVEKFAGMLKCGAYESMWAEDAIDQASRIIFCEVG